MKKILLLLLLVGFAFTVDADHLIFSRITITPNEAEMVAIYNPTPTAIDLDNYYLSDAEYTPLDIHYYNLPLYPGSNYYYSLIISLLTIITFLPLLIKFLAMFTAYVVLQLAGLPAMIVISPRVIPVISLSTDLTFKVFLLK